MLHVHHRVATVDGGLELVHVRAAKDGTKKLVLTPRTGPSTWRQWPRVMMMMMMRRRRRRMVVVVMVMMMVTMMMMTKKLVLTPRTGPSTCCRWPLVLYTK
jgi:hypothetical protein